MKFKFYYNVIYLIENIAFKMKDYVGKLIQGGTNVRG